MYSSSLPPQDAVLQMNFALPASALVPKKPTNENEGSRATCRTCRHKSRWICSGLSVVIIAPGQIEVEGNCLRPSGRPSTKRPENVSAAVGID